MHTFQELRGYSWLMLAGLVLSIVFWSRLARRDGRLLPVYVGAVLGAFLGAKLCYFAAEGWMKVGTAGFWLDLATGKTILGAMLGGYLGVEGAKKAVGYKEPTGDWFALIVPAGITLGRIGCLLHGCCRGKVFESPHWFTVTGAAGIHRWPAVPAEIAFNVVALLVALALRRFRLLAGQHFHLYLIAYGVFRFFHEFLRGTPRVLGPFSGYHALALAVAVLGLVRFYQRCRTTA
ncbi:MAG: prolipoprotein diacylglyceryl transferase [Verrucomicrobiae bacterium]|nr:prolipoprotein diacylglyceryl transferase [Verrucomicrobiae bacterium]